MCGVGVMQSFLNLFLLINALTGLLVDKYGLVTVSTHQVYHPFDMTKLIAPGSSSSIHGCHSRLIATSGLLCLLDYFLVLSKVQDIEDLLLRI